MSVCAIGCSLFEALNILHLSLFVQIFFCDHTLIPDQPIIGNLIPSTCDLFSLSPSNSLIDQIREFRARGSRFEIWHLNPYCSAVSSNPREPRTFSSFPATAASWGWEPTVVLWEGLLNSSLNPTPNPGPARVGTEDTRLAKRTRMRTSHVVSSYPKSSRNINPLAVSSSWHNQNQK